MLEMTDFAYRATPLARSARPAAGVTAVDFIIALAADLKRLT
jgi:hypothetical protein